MLDNNIQVSRGGVKLNPYGIVANMLDCYILVSRGWVNPHGVVANMLDCDILVSEFELQLLRSD